MNYLLTEVLSRILQKSSPIVLRKIPYEPPWYKTFFPPRRNLLCVPHGEAAYLSLLSGREVATLRRAVAVAVASLIEASAQLSPRGLCYLHKAITKVIELL